jgi:hypothetical protein
MSWLQSPRPPVRPPPVVRRAIGPGLGITLIVVGAVLLFALTAGSPPWLNLRIVGVILILAGAFGMALPRLGRRRPSRSNYPDRLSRWVLPGQFPARGESPGPDGDHDPGEPLLIRELSAEDPPTLADDVLALEHDPPL